MMFKTWESPSEHCLHDMMSSTTRNALLSILIPPAVSDRHDVLFKQHNTHTPATFLTGTSPKLRFHMLHQSNPNCCRRLAAGFWEHNRPHGPWPLNTHYVASLHLCTGIFPMSYNLNRCSILAHSRLTFQNLRDADSSQMCALCFIVSDCNKMRLTIFKFVSKKFP